MTDHRRRHRKSQITTVLADDHPVVRQAVRQYLADVPSLEIVAETGSGKELETIIRDHQPDLLLLDPEMEPDFDPVQALTTLREIHPALKVVVFSAHDEPHLVLRMLEARADGYAYKGAPLTELVSSIQAVINGSSWYSPGLLQDLATEYWLGPGAMLEEHERCVLQHIADGMMVRQTADRLLVSERSVHNYLASAMQKLGAQTRTQAVANALRRRLIQ